MLTSKYIATGYSNNRNAFVIEVDTTIVGVGTVSAINQFVFPVFETQNYSLLAVNGSNIINFGILSGQQTLTFPTAGVWELRMFPISPNPLSRVFFNNSGDRRKLTKIKQWGGVKWTSLNNAYWGCANLDVTATDIPNLSIVNEVAQQTFRECTSLVFNNSINSWDFSRFLNLFAFFAVCPNFNQPLGNIDISNTSSLFAFLSSASSFNQNLATWNLRTLGTSLNSLFANTAMNTANYTDTIVGWANYVLDNGAPFNVPMTGQTGRVFTNARNGGANFANAGAARTYLTTTAGWTISGDTVI